MVIFGPFLFLFLKLVFMSVGDVLITAATGQLSDLEADRAGLVPTHAYAVLELRKFKVWEISSTGCYSSIFFRSFLYQVQNRTELS